MSAVPFSTDLDHGLVGMLARFGVERGMHELMLPDGTLHRLHFVREHGLRDRYLRALRLADEKSFTVFDLRHLSRSLGSEIPGYLERDVPGLVKYTLRPLFPNAQAFIVAVAGFCLAKGKPAIAT